MLKKKAQMGFILLALAAGWLFYALTGCNAKPFDYQPTAGEMKEGPGVFTGKSGELTVYDSQKGGIFPKDSDAKTADGKGENTAETAGAVQQPAPMPVGTQNYREFQEFQQWQKEARSATDYQEFLEWKEFKTYQEWKKSQQ